MVYYVQLQKSGEYSAEFFKCSLFILAFLTLCCQLMFYTNAYMIQGGSLSLLAAAAVLCVCLWSSLLSNCFC